MRHSKRNRNMKTLIMAIHTGRDARDLLRTDVLKVLRANDLRIVILSPAADEDYFREEFAGDNVTVEKLHPAPGGLELIFTRLMHKLFCSARFSETMDIKYERRRRLTSSWILIALSFWLSKNVSRLVPCRNTTRKMLRRLNVILFPDRYYGELFKKYEPELVLTTHTFGSDDTPVLKRAIQNKVPTISMASSWDVLTTKGQIPVQIDKLIVWNEIVKEEAVKLHGFSANDVYIVGGPQFDLYFRREELLARDEFFRKIGADTNRKLLTYTTSTPSSMPFEPEIIEIISHYIEENRFCYPCQLLMRLNPRDDFNRYENIKGLENVILERAGQRSQSFRDRWNPNEDDMLHLANLMLHSDVVINVASTITIDASCFDTPVVNIAFDGYQKQSYWNSVARYYDYTHYKNIVKSGGVRIGRSAEELLKHINAYLENPKLDSKGRKRIMREQCYKSDGRAGERVANCILDFMNSNAKTR
ncbi:hypothetical protein ES703_80950 [subsurface metagenome]